MILDLLKLLSGTPPMQHPTDYATLAGRPHFRTYLNIEPHFPSEGPQAVRSWFGGMPELLESQAWPRDEDGTPYVFLAQICCTDFPKDLWGGIGPRMRSRVCRNLVERERAIFVCHMRASHQN